MSTTSWEEEGKLDFVTLAKAGGRKNLLYHHENKRQGEAQPYAPSVEWFSHPSPIPKGPISPYRSPLAGSWMVWKKTNDNKRLPELHVPTTEPLVQKKEPNLNTSLPPLSRNDGVVGVDMRRLLSLDYQREWLEEKERKKLELQKKAKAKRLAQKRKLQEHTVKQRAVNASTSSDSPPKRFIMKKFAKVPPKLKLPPI